MPNRGVSIYAFGTGRRPYTDEGHCSKANRIEIYTLTSDGLALQHANAIYGKVTMLQRLRPASSATDHLFIGTDRYMYFTVSWDSQAKQLRTETSYVDQADKTARDSQAGDRCLIDPTRRFMTLELFEGVITVVPIIQKNKNTRDAEIGSLGEPIPARISELFVRSSAFLHPKGSPPQKPTLALLYEDNQQKVHITVRTLDYAAGGIGEPGSAELEKVDSTYEDFQSGASHLIPVPAPACMCPNQRAGLSMLTRLVGMFILAETSISYVNDADGERLFEPLRGATIFVTWEQIDSQSWLLADEYGKLYSLTLMLEDDNTVCGWKLGVIGETSRASVLVYLDGGYVFVGSHQGDSQVFKIQGNSISLVQTISNIAPILDFTVMDMGSRAGEGQTNEYSSGQARIVTGSGAFQDGSLRSIRSGVGLEELGVLGEMDHITNLFPLRSSSIAKRTDVLIVSFVDETRVFKFSAEGEVEEVDDYRGLSLSEGTLLASNLPQDRLLQITSSSVRLLDLENGMLVSDWSSPEGQAITTVSANDQHVALSIGGIEAVILSLAEELRVVTRKGFGAQSQIACLSIPSILSGICIIGFWQNTAVAILRLDTLEAIETVTVGDEAGAVPRSVLLTQLIPEQPPTLFVAMADGNVVTFSMDPDKFTLFAKKSIVLGTQYANFKALPRGDGLFNVFATCEHPSLIYGSEGRIVYSAITAEKATCICQFDSEAYPGAIAIATPEDLKIALVDTERTTHVRTLPVHETVRRVAYSTKLKAFGLGTIRRTLRDNVEIVQSHFKLADEVLFKELDTYELNEDELVESVIRADLDSGHGKTIERFVVGTAYLDDERDDAVRGRILVFGVNQERTLKLATELAVKGACRALGIVAGHIVAALIKTVRRPPTYPPPSPTAQRKKEIAPLTPHPGRRLRLHPADPHQTRHLPDLDRADRPVRVRQQHRHRGPHEERLGGGVPGRQRRPPGLPRRSRAPFPDGVGHGRRARRRRLRARERCRGELARAAAECRGRDGRRSQTLGGRRRDPARRDGQSRQEGERGGRAGGAGPAQGVFGHGEWVPHSCVEVLVGALCLRVLGG